MFKIDFFYFTIALIIGLILSYYLSPEPELIIKYPTPENAGKIIYRDDNNVCYKYRAVEIPCPKDMKNVKTDYLQTINKSEKNKNSILKLLHLN